jgi:hypothetical protein
MPQVKHLISSTWVKQLIYPGRETANKLAYKKYIAYFESFKDFHFLLLTFYIFNFNSSVSVVEISGGGGREGEDA